MKRKKTFVQKYNLKNSASLITAKVKTSSYLTQSFPFTQNRITQILTVYDEGKIIHPRTNCVCGANSTRYDAVLYLRIYEGFRFPRKLVLQPSHPNRLAATSIFRWLYYTFFHRICIRNWR